MATTHKRIRVRFHGVIYSNLPERHTTPKQKNTEKHQNKKMTGDETAKFKHENSLLDFRGFQPKKFPKA